MKFEEFQKYYEDEGDKIYKKLSKLNEADLLQLIADKDRDKYEIWKGKDNYQVWKVLQVKGTAISIQPLFKIITGLKNEYLICYHATTALFGIAKINDDDFKGEIQFGLDKDRQPIDRQKAFTKLENMLSKYLNTNF